MIDISQAHVFAEGLDHPEGVAIHPDGSVWAGGEGGQIYRISEDGKQVDEITNTKGFVLGLAFSQGAEWLLACDLANHCIWKIDPVNGEMSVVVEAVEGVPLKIPNYICFDNDGGFFFSESGDFRKVNGAIGYVDAEGKSHWWHTGPFNFANGIALWEDWLYVVCSFLPGIERVKIKPDGTAGAREVFATLPKSVPDGLAFDKDGVLYVSCYAPNTIYRMDADRNCEVWIDDWEAHTLSNPTNIAFGGPDHKEMYCSNLGRWHITRIETDIVGHRLPSHK